MGNIKIQCTECERITEYDEYEFNHDEPTCRECGGDFEEVESDDERYIEVDCRELTEEDVDEYEESEEDKKIMAQPLEEPTQDIVIDDIVEQDDLKTKFDPEAKTRFD